VLEALDWSLLADFGDLAEHIGRVESAQPELSEASRRELLSYGVALLLLDVLHYGGFKGENFWFGLWRPAHSLEDFVASSQERQYRLHKEAIEMYLNAGVVGPIVGFFSFMFRDADWQAATWGVVDAAWVPKKAYRAYRESNHAVRVSLPHALRAPVKFAGDPWFRARGDGWEQLADRWVASDVIVGNDTGVPLGPVTVSVWVEDASGEAMPSLASEMAIDENVEGGWSGAWSGATAVVPDDVTEGTYYLKAKVEAQDGRGSTNAYEFLVLDTTFAELDSMTKPIVKALLDGASGTEGFHYWQNGVVAHRARPGLRGLLHGFRRAQAKGIDLNEVVQGEHLFRHVLHELSGFDAGGRVRDDIWRMRSETVSPREKARALLRYIEFFVERAEQRLASTGRARRSSPPSTRPTPPRSTARRVAATPVGRDIAYYRND
ncbi:MAG: hypothetical protein LC792_19675, partial [Actinobacteria bacterium]|nr:hypothetical protein [Actinomycetota bacterium]